MTGGAKVDDFVRAGGDDPRGWEGAGRVVRLCEHGRVPTNHLEGLDDQQRAAVVAPSGPVCVLAGAGTGKTRTITHRIAHLVATGAHPVSEILAVTFTTRAAGEMRLRLRALGVPGVQARTFHSAALKQLRYFWPRAVGGQLWPVLEHKLRLVAIAARRANAGTDAATLRDLASEIEWSKASLPAPSSTWPRWPGTSGTPRCRPRRWPRCSPATSRPSSRPSSWISTTCCCTPARCSRTTATSHPSSGRATGVSSSTSTRTSPAAAAAARRLARRPGHDHRRRRRQPDDLLLRRASPSYLLNFEKRYPNAEVVKLERDYRSTPQVVGLANRSSPGPPGRRTGTGCG